MDYGRSSADGPVIMPSAGRNNPTVSGLEGSYRIVRLLGRGTMSSVYLAEQVSMARPVALKILSSDISSNPHFVEHFFREARASARLNHPNIVSAIDFGESDARFFLAMEFVDGMSLAALLARDGALEEKQVISIGLQVISALRHASQHNVVHLDVKPANIMLCKDGRVKLTDFGLSLILDGSEEPGGTGKAVGTPYYMAPEQVEGGAVDWRTDQFSLGASLYEAVTGNKPYQGSSVSDILVKRLFEKPEPAWSASRKKASRAFSAVLSKMLSRSPDGRYQSFDDLETDFARVKVGKKPAVAKMPSISAMTAPSSAAWDSFGNTSVASRVNGLQRDRRWNWIILSSLFFLFFLGLYSSMQARALMGPMPPRLVNQKWLDLMDALPPETGEEVREIWVGAAEWMMRAEREPTEENLRRAIVSYAAIYSNRRYADTAYAAAARRRAERMIGQLREMGIEFSWDYEPEHKEQP